VYRSQTLLIALRKSLNKKIMIISGIGCQLWYCGCVTKCLQTL